MPLHKLQEQENRKFEEAGEQEKQGSKLQLHME